MAIPQFNEQGWLPEGIHECTIEEAAQQFGVFQRSDRRPQLWAKFMEFVQEAKASGFVEAIVVDGSFVTADPIPHDIDVILVVSARYKFSGEIPPAHYNVLSQRRVRRQFELDMVVVHENSENLEEAIAFFQQVRQQPSAKKGLVRIRL